MTTIRRAGCVVGVVLAVLFIGSIVSDLTTPDERCDECGAAMEYDYGQPGVGSVLVLYRCPDKECDRRGQREFRDDGTIHWTEW